MRSEIWPRLQQEIAEGIQPAPHNHDFSKPWGTIISGTRFGVVAGLKADWWREREICLERGQHSRPGSRSEVPVGEGAEPPPLPSFARVGQQAEGWGSGGEPKAPPPRPKAKPQPRGPKGGGKGQRNVGATGLPLARKGPCWHCGGAHLREQCAKWIQAGRPDGKAKGKGAANKTPAGETQGQGEAAGKASRKKRKAS